MIITLVELAGLVAVLGVGAAWATSVIYARGRLQGLREAMREMASGVGSTYQSVEMPLPDNVKSALRTIQREVARASGAPQKADALARTLRRLGKEMGTAARLTGYESGHKDGALPLNNEIRMDLSLRDLLTVRWLAHAGFKLMMRNKVGGKFCFRDETDAQESNFALDRLEWRLGQEHADPTAPHALALGRQKLIWDRWPHSDAPAEAERNAA